VAKKYHKNNLIFNGQNLLSKLGSRLQPAENIRSIMPTRLPRSLSPPFFLSTLSQARVIWVAPTAKEPGSVAKEPVTEPGSVAKEPVTLKSPDITAEALGLRHAETALRRLLGPADRLMLLGLARVVAGLFLFDL
jgi:hypothetical protein